MLQKFSALLKEIVNTYPEDLSRFLEQKLQIPENKAKELAQRIENNFNLKINHEIRKKLLEFSSYPQMIEENDQKKFNIYSLDNLSGKEFEQFLKWFLEELGYQVRLTKLTADSGVDLVILNNGEKIAVQAKRYKRSSKVPNSVILKTRGGQAIYGCDRSLVITTSFFTQQAIKEAKQLNIELWDRNFLSARIDQLDQEISESKKGISFPPYASSLLSSLQTLDQTGIFYIKHLKNERYHIYRHGIKHPLISFHTDYRKVKSLDFRIVKNEPVPIDKSLSLIYSDSHYTYGPSGAVAYEQIKNYLSQFLAHQNKKTEERDIPNPD